MLKINETPVRTSKIFGINNIKLENIEIPNRIKEFEGLTIIGDTSNIEINENISNFDIKYGLSDKLINQKSNQKIKITVNDKADANLFLNFDFDEDYTHLIDKIEIVSEPNSKATIVIKYKSSSDDKNFHNGMLKLISKENSETNIIIVNLLNLNSNNFMTIDNELYEKSKSNFTIVDFGGKNSISNYYSNLIGDNSDNSINTIYIGKENQLFDLNFITELRGNVTNVKQR